MLPPEVALGIGLFVALVFLAGTALIFLGPIKPPKSGQTVRSAGGVSCTATGKSVRIEIEPGGVFRGTVNGIDIEVVCKRKS